MDECMFLNCWSDYVNDHYDHTKCPECSGTGVAAVYGSLDQHDADYNVIGSLDVDEVVDFEFECECGASMSEQHRKAIETAYALAHDASEFIFDLG